MSGTTGQSAEILAFSDGPPGPTLGMVDRGSLSIDLPKLLATRMLIQAASGGGKSYALRRLLEQTHGLVQQIVIDPEGELVTLAEGFDYLVCGPDAGHAPIRADMGAKVADLIFESRTATTATGAMSKVRPALGPPIVRGAGPVPFARRPRFLRRMRTACMPTPCRRAPVRGSRRLGRRPHAPRSGRSGPGLVERYRLAS